MQYHKTCVVDTEGFFKFIDNNEEERQFVVSNLLDTYKVTEKPTVIDGKWNNWENITQMNQVIVKFVEDYFIFYDENLNNITEHVYELTNLN